jgi:hypothetical protein
MNTASPAAHLSHVAHTHLAAHPLTPPYPHLLALACGMHFEFINNNSKLCNAAKRRIRTHAAKDKNLGRTVVRPSKKNLQRRVIPFRVALPRTSSSSETSLSSASEHEVTLTIGRQIGDSLSVLPFPVELSQGPRELVNKGKLHFQIDHLCMIMNNFA